MSQIDAGLLQSMGYSASSAGKVLGRTRQAISRGIKPDEPAKADVVYFKDMDVRALYQAMVGTTPGLVPVAEAYIKRYFPAAASLLGITPTQKSFEERLDGATRAWLLIRDFGKVQSELWATLRVLMERSDMTVDVFVDDDVSHASFLGQAEAVLNEVRRTKTVQAQVKLWPAMPVIGLIPPTAILDPFSLDGPAAFSWKGAAFEPMEGEDARRLVDVFMSRVLTPPPVSTDKILIRNLGVTDAATKKLEAVDKEEAVHVLAAETLVRA